jgi:hypothetical protein
VDVASSLKARLRIALDALEPLRDDLPVSGLSAEDLDAESVASFRAALLKRFPQWEALSLEDFLKRSLVLSSEVVFEGGAEAETIGVTCAGQLLLGKNDVLARIAWRAGTEREAEMREVRNLWSACALWPRLVEAVPTTRPCEDALRECFVNALLHADYAFGHVEITLGEGIAFFSNPGLPRTRTPGESAARNGRLMRILTLAGLARGQGKGLEVIHAFDGQFEPLWDTLELATVTKLPLKTADASRVLGWLPVALNSPAAIPPLLFKWMGKAPDLPESFIDVLRPSIPEEDSISD